MRSPVIGLTTYNTENPGGHKIAALAHKYIDAIIDAGGLPVLIPSGLREEALLALLTRLDGILLTGGGDIASERYGGEYHPGVADVDETRDATEIFLVRNSIDSQKPFFGICRGFQVVNVALGGSLYADLQEQFPNALKHDYDSYTQRQYLAHAVNLDASSGLSRILGETTLQVNSLHHQGLKELSASLVATAHAPDGLVEAVEIPGHTFGLAVQWHPEWLSDQPATKRLFRAFVEAAGRE